MLYVTKVDTVLRLRTYLFYFRITFTTQIQLEWTINSVICATKP